MIGVTRRTTIAIVLVGLSMFVVSACGGDDSSSSDGTTTEESGGAAAGTLQGVTGPGFTIEVSQDGADAETVEAGTYTLTVEDKSEMHNFHLIGPGVDEEVTDLPFVGEKSVEVTLEPGTYTYQCDPHAAQGMKGTFTVT